jgi:CRP/FNR family cyclic AMP-dependent transcriptional regulator
MKTTLDLLTEHRFLDGLPRPWLQRLSGQAHRAVWHSGHRLFSENRPADRFWLLREGAVALDTSVPGGGVVTIDTVGAGDILGWSWLFPPYRWHFGAVAVEHTLAIEFNAAGVRRLAEEDHALGHELTSRLMKVVVDRLQATRIRLLNRADAASG